MLFRRACVALATVSLCAVGWIVAGPAGATTPTPALKVTPAKAPAGATKNVALTFTAPKTSAFSGTVHIDVPGAFLPPQTSSPSGVGYLRIAATSCAGVGITSIIGHTITLNVACAAAERVKLTWSQVAMPHVASTYPINASTSTGGAYTPIDATPAITVTALKATHLDVTAPATVASNTPFDVTVKGSDRFGNADPTFRQRVHLSTTPSGGTVPSDYLFVAADHGAHVFHNGVSLGTSSSINVTTLGRVPLTGSAAVALVGSPPPGGHFVITPGSATITGGSKTFAASLDGSDVTATSAFAITPDGSCAGAVCTPAHPGPHLVTVTNGDNTASALLVNDGGCNKTWAHPGTSDSWTSAAAWNPVGAPITTDIVCLPAGSYTVAGDQIAAQSIAIGHGVLLHAGHGATGAYVVADSLVNHGTVWMDSSSTGLGMLAGGSMWANAGDGELNTGGYIALHANIINAGAMNLGGTFQYGCPSCTTGWTNLAGSNLGANGQVLIGSGAQTFDHQAGATLTIATPTSFLIGGGTGSGPTFIDNGGSISNSVVNVDQANVTFRHGNTGTFILRRTVFVAGTISHGINIFVSDGDSFGGSAATTTLVAFDHATNNASIGAIGGGGGISFLGDLTNGAQGQVTVDSGQFVWTGNIDNAGSIVVGSKTSTTSLRYGSFSTDVAWKNHDGGFTTVFGKLYIDTHSTYELDSGATLGIDGAALVLVGRDQSPSFMPHVVQNSGSSISGRIDFEVGYLTLNGGFGGTFVTHAFSALDGTIGSGQTVVVDPNQSFGASIPIVNATWGTTALTNHGHIVLSAAGTTSTAVFKGALTNASDGTVTAQTGSANRLGIGNDPFVNNGTLEIASDVVVNVGGNFSQGATGTYKPAIASGGSAGLLNVAGTATLAGTLQATVSSSPSGHFKVFGGNRGGSQFASNTTTGYTVNYTDPNAVFLDK